VPAITPALDPPPGLSWSPSHREDLARSPAGSRVEGSERSPHPDRSDDEVKKRRLFEGNSSGAAGSGSAEGCPIGPPVTPSELLPAGPGRVQAQIREFDELRSPEERGLSEEMSLFGWSGDVETFLNGSKVIILKPKG
jgi:hypothetical protein